MKSRIHTGGAGADETAALTALSEATAASTGAKGRIRRYLGAVWSFTRHLLEMVVAMIAGMFILGVAIGALGEPPGYSSLLV